MFPVPNCITKEQSEDTSIEVNLTSLFKLFTKDINKQDEMKPSTYQKEITVSLRDRLKQLRSISKYNEYFNKSHGGDFFDCFDVDPCILVFQNWEAKKQYETSISIRNKTKKLKFISLSIEPSEIFLISPKIVRKLSSLSSLVYKVKFLPVHSIYYKIKMTINSDDSFYEFEMIALPPRPIFNFPDKIDFGKILINYKSIKLIYLTNSGGGNGMAKLYATNQDIHIEPEYVCMNAHEALDLEIKIHPSVLGQVKEKIIILYSTGEQLFVEVQAFVVRGNIYLSEKELVMKETFITFNTLSSLVVHNKTNYSLNFRWHQTEEDNTGSVRKIRSTVFGYDRKSEKMLDELDSITDDSSDHKDSGPIVQGDFSIAPMEGVITMNDSLTFMVMFNPMTVGKAESIFYLEVEGLENRLHVNIRGFAHGPNICLNLSTLDINDIYVNEKYNYQLFAKNSCLVRGTIRLLPMSVFDNVMAITVDLEEAVLNPNDILLINISITTGVIGSFVFELRFEIVESKNIIRCIIKGTAIEPIIKIDHSCIDFGTVPIGLSFEKYFTIANHSSIKVHLQLRIPLEGFDTSVIYNDHIRGSVTGLPKRPNEFHLDPDDLIIEGKSRAKIKVSLVANISRKFCGDILISSESHLTEEIKLPICFNARAPDITCFPNSMTLPYCFKGIEYERKIMLSNKENVQVSFWLLDYVNEKNGLKCHGKGDEIGMIRPLQSGEFTLRLSVGSVGEHSFTLLAFILGNGIIPICDITLVGMGAVILVETASLVWPHIDILSPFNKSFVMVNNSPIPAEFTITLEKDPKLWIISPSEGIIEPDGTFHVTVTPKPIDVGPLKDRLQIQVKDSRMEKIRLEAFATGTSIQFSPDIFPSIDFGAALRVADNNRKIVVSNIGSQPQLVVLSSHESPTMRKIRTQGSTLGEHFIIQPSAFIVPEYSEVAIWVSLKSETLGIKEETIYCFTRIERKYKMTYLGSSIMRANFIDLNFTYDPTQLHFNIVSNINQDPSPTSRPFIMYTNWNSPVKVLMVVPVPFGIFKDNRVIHEETFMISVDAPLITDVYFDPMFVKDYKIQSYSITLSFFIVDYNCEKSCTISADVYFPNISLSASKIDFECVELYQTCCKELILKNATQTPISYQWFWVSVIPSYLDKNNPEHLSREMSPTKVHKKKNELCERTRSSLKILKTMENQRFRSFKEFENKARCSGLDVCPIVKSDSLYPKRKKKTLMDEECASYLEFIPFWGDLEGKKCLITFINFTPRSYLFFEAIAVCVVQGGPTERLIIKGSCSPIKFEIIPSVISFGYAPCCELCKTMLIIKNNSLKKLPFKIHAPQLPPIDKKLLQESGIWVDQESGILNPYSTTQVKITVWFGSLGETEFNVLIEVNTKPNYIKILAYCCPNQIMISLPRNFPQLMEEYLILASLREPWFFVPEFTTRNEDDWEYIILPEMLPSTGDIYLGMERYFLHLLLTNRPSLFAGHFLAKKRSLTIKGFEVPGYLLDFGIVLLGTRAVYKVKILNYYPREIVLKLVCKHLSKLKDVEFEDLQNYLILPPLGSSEFSISIFVRNMFEKSDININYAFDIEVMCGPRIPVTMTAIVTLPRLLVPDSIDFGAIYCNQMKIINIPIKNIGIIPCEWIVVLRDIKGEHLDIDDPKSYIRKPFIIKKCYGYTEPNNSENIPVYFKPKRGGEYSMMLEFIINMNPERISIQIKGAALKPLIVLSDIDFGYVTPFCKPIVKNLEIINLSSFPLEIFFPAYDDEFMAETLVFQAVNRYYKKGVYVLSTENEIIPYNKIGNIYRRLCDEAIILEKFSRLYNIGDYYHVPFFGLKRSKSEIVLRKRYQLDLRRCNSLQNIEIKDKMSSLLNVCFRKSPDQLLEEYLNYLECGCRPIPKYLTIKDGSVFCSKPDPLFSQKFTMIIVLGAPQTGHIEWAAKLAKAFGMVSVSLDEIIFQELSESDSEIAKEICSRIRKIYIEEIAKDDCFDDSRKYPTDYLELKFMVEELMSKYPLELFGLSTAQIRIGEIVYSQTLPFGLTVKRLKELIRNRISTYSTNIVIESVEGIFFTDVTIAVHILIELFGEKMDFHVINLHSLPLWYLKLVQKFAEMDADNSFKTIVENMAFFHGIEHAKIISEIPAFVRRYYYLFNVGYISEGSEDDFLSNRPGRIQEKQKHHSMQSKETVLEDEAKPEPDTRPPFIQTIQELCDDIINSKSPDIVWTRSFFSHSDLQSLLKEFMNYARWFSSLKALWSTMWYSKLTRPSRTFHFIRKSMSGRRYSRLSRSSRPSRSLRPSRLSRESSFGRNSISSRRPSRSSAHYKFEPKANLKSIAKRNVKFSSETKDEGHPNDFSRGPILRRPSKTSFYSGKNIHRHFSKIYFDFSRKSVACIERPSRTSISSEKIFRKQSVSSSKLNKQIKSIPEMPLWILCTEDLDFEKFIPLLCSQKRAFGLEHTEHSRELIRNSKGLIPEPKVYFRLRSPKTVVPYAKLTNFELYNETDEENLLEKHEIRGTFRERPSERDDDPKRISNKSFEIKSINQYDSLLSPKQSLGEVPTFDFDTRKYLEPGEKASWKVVYSPVSCGIISNILTVRTAGFHDFYTAQINGVCDIPTVSYEFEDVVIEVPDSSGSSAPPKIGFCPEESIYYFKPSLVSKLKKHKNSKTEPDVATFSITNVSRVTAKVFIGFQRKSKEFNVLPKIVDIEPHEAATITIFSSMTNPGSYMNELFISTLNNPLAQSLKVKSEGILPVIDFNPPKIKFHNMILYQEKISQFTITNLCYKPVYWEIISVHSLAPVIGFSKTFDILEPDTTEEIIVSYRPRQCVDFKRIFIQVTDAETKKLLKFKVYPLHLFATDVQVQINSNLNTQNYLKFGDIKVLNKYVSKVTVTVSMYGRSKVFYSARIATNNESKQHYNISDYIAISSNAEGYIYKKSGVDLTVEIYCEDEVYFDEVKAIFVEIYSPFDSSLKIAEIPLIFSFHSHFPKYTLYPGDCLDFGNVEIDTEKKLYLTLENIGFVDFDYSVKGSIVSEESIICSRDRFMSQETIMKTISLPPLKISKGQGTIEPGKQHIFEVVCKPITVQKIFQDIFLLIPELTEKHRKISISCVGTAPALNFDIESLFRELNIVNTREELSGFSNGRFVAVFIKTECTLYLKNVSLYQTVTVDIYIENKSLLSCNVSLIVSGAGFSIEQSDLFIKSYQKEIVTLTYSPQRFGVHKGSVEIKLDLPYTIENSSFTILVEGNSELPVIAFYDYSSEKSIQNTPIRIGYTANTTPVRHLLKIRNTGNIFSQTLIDVESATNTTVSLCLVSIQNKIGPDSECDTKFVRLYLHPQETAVLGCTLTPYGVGMYNAVLTAYTVLNPYEKKKVILTGEAIVIDILLDGLTLTNYFLAHTSEETGISIFYPYYTMNFGLCGSHMEKKFIFYINNLIDETWAFKFSLFEYISFTPEMGYLSPFSRVKIEALLFPDIDFLPDERGALFLAKVLIDESTGKEPPLLWQIRSDEEVCHSSYEARRYTTGTIRTLRSNATTRTFRSNATTRTVMSRYGRRKSKDTQEVQTPKIIIRSIDSKIILLAKCWSVETSLRLYRDQQSKFRFTVVKQCSDEILYLQNSSEASCHVVFQLENITFKELDDEREFFDKIGFVKMPSHSKLMDKPEDELQFFDMDQSFPDVSLNDVFRPLFVQDMLLHDSTVKARFTFCPPKPGIYSANVRIIMDGTLLDFPQTQFSVMAHIPPIQIVFKNEFQCSEAPASVKCIKITAYEPKSLIRNKLIYVYNATKNTFSYKWYNKHNISTIENSSTGFYCHQVYGDIEKQSMLKLEMIFNPQDYGVYKSFWHLKIPDHNTEQTFLFIGETRIPHIIFEPNILRLDPMLLDMKVEKKVTIYNKEKVPFKYKVDDVSLYSDIECEKLVIDPPSGVLEPNMPHEVTISSTLRAIRKHVYKTFWNFENVAKSWCLKVITQCLNVDVDVCCLIERNKTNETITLKENETNFIDVGKVVVNDVLDLVFVLSNKGKVGITYDWILSDKDTNKLDIKLNPHENFVPAFTELSSVMKVTVLEKFNFRNISFTLKIFKGPVYTVFLNGSSEDPLYRFSFKEHDFGVQLIQSNNIVYNTINLQLENLDEEVFQFEVESPAFNHFKIDLTCSIVHPKSVIDIPVHFFPRSKRKYNEKIDFIINDTFKDAIVLLGEGELFEVDVVKPLKGIITFDQICIDELIIKKTEIINPCKIVLNINLKVKNEYKESVEIVMDPVEPELRPNLLCNISVYVRCYGLGHYSGIEVWATCREYEIRLYCLTIHCVGAKFAFDRETINFFPHFRKRIQREKVAIINSGNIPARFRLDTSDLPKMFEVQPMQGECFPGIPFILNILCCLKFITDYLSAKVKCFEDGKTDYIELTFVTYPFPPSIEVQTLTFLCPVRQENAQSISVRNGTLKTMSLMPTITGNYFSGEVTLEVPPHSEENYTVLYKPLSMTKSDQTHKGILVIPTQPQEMIVKLEGRSTEPLSEGSLRAIVIAREKCLIKLTVKNPLETLQKMSVQFRKSPSNKNVFNIEGSKCLMLSSNEKKEYIINFYAYKEGTVHFDVIFTNEETSEYMFYQVKVIIHPSEEIWETIEMNSLIDHSINKIISIYNPLQVNDTFKIILIEPTIDRYLKFEPSVINVQPEQKEEFSIVYSPKKLEKREVKLKVTSNLVGDYFYRIILGSEQPISSSIISLSTFIGSEIIFILKLPKPIIKKVPLPSKSEFFKRETVIKHKVSTLCHSVKVSVMVLIEVIHRHRKLVKEILIFKATSDNEKVTIKPLDENSPITEEIVCSFEPSIVGTNTAVVTAEYFRPYEIFKFKLVCECGPPQPQGPFDIYAFEPFILVFKNVFYAKQTFSCSCVYDDCCLVLPKPVFTLEARQAKEIKLSLKKDADLKEYTTMLRITDLPDKIYKWDYYFNVHR